MQQSLMHIPLVVKDCDEALDFYLNTLNFELVEDTYQPEQDKRWVVIAPPGSSGATLLLAWASTPEQAAFIGDQAGGRVFLFLRTDDFWRDYHAMREKGVEFVRPPKEADYGTVAVFKDLYGNLWDLLELHPDHPMAAHMSQLKKHTNLWYHDDTLHNNDKAEDHPGRSPLESQSYKTRFRFCL